MSRKTPPSTVYTKEYLLSSCAGFKEFSEGQISPKHEKAIQYLGPRPNERILDVGCGRGEIVEGCGRMGADVIGCDYSSDAIEIAKNYTTNGNIMRADASYLPFKDCVFDKVALLETVEHLDREDLKICLGEIHRVLKESGEVIVSTPNRWRYLYRLLGSTYKMLTSRRIDTQHKNHIKSWHINEQSYMTLKKVVSSSGFYAKCWFDCEVPQYLRSLKFPPLRLLLGRMYKLLFFITGELWCIAYKK